MNLSDIAHQFDLPPNRLYQLKEARRKAKKPILDLISGNVNAQGIYFPPRVLQSALRKGWAAARTYHPDSLGQPVAREAVRRWYASSGLQIPAEQVVITPGTSISYWYAFKTLANPGDEILSPTPSYPLFEAIAGLSGVHLKPYRLHEGSRWTLDMDHLESQITSRTKALILISPHNPTGAVASDEEIAYLGRLAEKHGIAILSDEVFSPFLFGRKNLPRAAHSRAPLVFTLNGLSKMLALPGMKIGWMAVSGDPSWVKASLKTLAMISDTFLPVQEAAQFALPDLLRQSRPFQTRYVRTIQKGLALTQELIDPRLKGCYVVPEGGFFLTLDLEGTGQKEEELTIRLLERHGILTHPGYFYDMEGQHLVFSFVSKPAVLRRALGNLLLEISR